MNKTEDQWLQIKNTPAEEFASILYDDLIIRVNSWNLAEEDSVVVKTYSADCSKVTENCYESVEAASEYLLTLDMDECDVVVMDQEGIQTSIDINED